MRLKWWALHSWQLWSTTCQLGNKSLHTVNATPVISFYSLTLSWCLHSPSNCNDGFVIFCEKGENVWASLVFVWEFQVNAGRWQQKMDYTPLYWVKNLHCHVRKSHQWWDCCFKWQLKRVTVTIMIYILYIFRITLQIITSCRKILQSSWPEGGCDSAMLCARGFYCCTTGTELVCSCTARLQHGCNK